MFVSKETLYVLLNEVYEIDDENDRSTEYVIQHLVDTVNEFDYREEDKDAHDIVMEFLVDGD